MKITAFKQLVFTFYLQSGRRFPWRETWDPYAITVSEIMLQQTQTERVVPKYEAFLKALPTWKSLAQAPVSEVLSLWQGLGYNRRALALKRMAEEVTEVYKGKLPVDRAALQKLPGIGPYTAGAILIFAFNEAVPVIETNIRRVFLHHFFADREGVPDQELFPLIEETMDQENPREWYYALMDYGSQLAKQLPNPNRRSAHYTKQGAFTGSNREVRGKLITLLLEERKVPRGKLAELLGLDPLRIDPALTQLAKEGFLVAENDFVILS